MAKVAAPIVTSAVVAELAAANVAELAAGEFVSCRQVGEAGELVAGTS